MKRSLKATISTVLVLAMSIACVSQTQFKMVSNDNGLSSLTLPNKIDTENQKSYLSDTTEVDNKNTEPVLQNLSLQKAEDDKSKSYTQVVDSDKVKSDKEINTVISSSVSEDTTESSTTEEVTQEDTEKADETFKYSDRYKGYSTGAELSNDVPEDVKTIGNVKDYYSVLSENGEVPPSASVENLPKSVDNSTSKYFPIIGNQASLGSCTCWAIVYYQFTYEFNRKNGIVTTPETTYSPLFTYNLVNGGADMGSFEGNVYYSLNKYGSPTNIEFPYVMDCTKWPTEESVWRSALSRKVKDYQIFDSIGTDDSNLVTSTDDKDLEAIKTALNNGEVLTYSTFIYSWVGTKLKGITGSNINSGYIGQEAIIKQEGSKGGHRMTMVGYNDDIWIDVNQNDKVDEGEMGAFKIANSWGSGYANNGFAWIAYDALNYKSCVAGVKDNDNRGAIFNSISRVDVGLYGDTSGVFLKAKLNSADKSHSYIVVTLNKDGTEIVGQLLSGGCTAVAYDGTTQACDINFIFDMNYFFDDMDSDTLKSLDISVNVKNTAKDNKPLIVKNLEIYDENEDISYGDSSIYPITLENSEKTIQITKSKANHAIVYYRGYEKPNIKYKLSNGSWNSNKGEPMEYNIESYGYIYKYVIDLKNTNEAYVCINDANGNYDDNNGKYYSVKRGYNYIVTENVGKPMDLTFNQNVSGIASLNTYFYLSNICATGGYEPYMYRVQIIDCADSSIYGETEYVSYDTASLVLKKEGKFKINVYAKDCTGKEIVKSQNIEVVDIPIEIEKLEILSGSDINVDDTIKFRALTRNDTYYPGGALYVSIVKDGVEVYKGVVETSKYDIQSRWADYRFKWVPKSAGKYYLTVQRRDYNQDYVSKSIEFTVNPTTLKSDIYIDKTENIMMGDTLKLSTRATGGSENYKYMYSYSRYGVETVISDYSSNSTLDFNGLYESGPYKLISRVKDSNDVESISTKDIWVNQGYIRSIYAESDKIEVGDSVKISAETLNISKNIIADTHIFTIEKNGVKNKVVATNDYFYWKPSEKGDYTVTYEIYDNSGSNLLTSLSKSFTVNENSSLTRITVAVISYIVNEGNESKYQVHYWGGSSSIGDSNCTKLGTTVKKSVGSGYWNGTQQKFYLYEAYIPKGATGYKFRIGDRWFGTDGNTATSNTVYIFNYSGDKCLYGNS